MQRNDNECKIQNKTNIDDWICNQCKMFNSYNTRNQCIKCQTKRPTNNQIKSHTQTQLFNDKYSDDKKDEFEDISHKEYQRLFERMTDDMHMNECLREELETKKIEKDKVVMELNKKKQEFEMEKSRIINEKEKWKTKAENNEKQYEELRNKIYFVTWEVKQDNNVWNIYGDEINQSIESLAIGKSLKFKRNLITKYSKCSGVQHNIDTNIRREIRRKEQETEKMKRINVEIRKSKIELENRKLVQQKTAVELENRKLAQQKTAFELENRKLAQQKTVIESENRKLAEQKNSLFYVTQSNKLENRKLAQQKTVVELENKKLAQQKTAVELENRKLAQQKTVIELENRKLKDEILKLQKNKDEVEVELICINEKYALLEQEKLKIMRSRVSEQQKYELTQRELKFENQRFILRLKNEIFTLRNERNNVEKALKCKVEKSEKEKLVIIKEKEIVKKQNNEFKCRIEESEKYKLKAEEIKKSIGLMIWQIKTSDGKWKSVDDELNKKTEALALKESYSFVCNGQTSTITRHSKDFGQLEIVNEKWYRSNDSQTMRRVKRAYELVTAEIDKKKQQVEMEKERIINEKEQFRKKAKEEKERIITEKEQFRKKAKEEKKKQQEEKKEEMKRMKAELDYKKKQVEMEKIRIINEKEEFRRKAEEEKKQKLETEQKYNKLKKDMYVIIWEWRENHNEWKLYTDDINTAIEALKIHESLTFTAQNRQTYVVTRKSKHSGTQKNMSTNFNREIRRREQEKGGYIEYPKWWNKNGLNQVNINNSLCDAKYATPQLIDIKNVYDEKWQEVANLFYNTSRDKYSYRQHNYENIKIIKIESVENQRLYDKYWNERNILKKSIGENKINEKILWHGTKKEETMDKIVKQGFRKEFNSTALWGNGTYFAVNAGYSIGYSSNSNGIYKMFQCKVICGESTVGHTSYDLKSWPKKPNELIYDSLVSKQKDIYVIHNDVRAYPMFVITFSNWGRYRGY